MSKFNEFVEDLRNAVVVKDEAAFSKYVDLCRNGVEFALENGYTKTKRPAESGYECHRFFPGALGGEYVSGNMSYLSQAEHLEAHYWLHLAVPAEQKFSTPIWRMCNGKKPTTIEDLDLAKEIYRVGSVAQVERMKEMHQDPEFKAANSARSRVHMAKMHKCPEFKVTHSARGKVSMAKMHKCPEFKAANSARGKVHMDKLNKCQEFKAANSARGKISMDKLNKCPEFKAAHSARLTTMNADPEFKAAHSARGKVHMAKLNTLNDRPWKHPRVKNQPDLLAIWAMLDQLYDYVTETGHGSCRCAKHFGYPPSKTWQNMVNYVRTNGDPRLDSEFLEFQSNQPVAPS